MDEIEQAKEEYFNYNIRGISEEEITNPSFYHLKETTTTSISLGTTFRDWSYQTNFDLSDIRAIYIDVKKKVAPYPYVRDLMFPYAVELNGQNFTIFQEQYSSSSAGQTISVSIHLSSQYSSSTNKATLYLSIQNNDSSNLDATLTLSFFN